MKKTLLIISSIVLGIILLGGAWWYLLMNGRPEGLSGIPNPFGTFGDDSEEFAPAPREPAIEPRVSGALRKLSEVPVAGAVLTRRDGASYARYVERGTGHIFEVDLASSATTAGKSVAKISSGALAFVEKGFAAAASNIVSAAGSLLPAANKDTTASAFGVAKALYGSSLEKSDVADLLGVPTRQSAPPQSQQKPAAVTADTEQASPAPTTKRPEPATEQLEPVIFPEEKSRADEKPVQTAETPASLGAGGGSSVTFLTEEEEAAKFTTSADKRFCANSKDNLVRVEFSKNKLATVRSLREGTFLMGRFITSLKFFAVSTIYLFNPDYIVYAYFNTL